MQAWRAALLDAGAGVPKECVNCLYLNGGGAARKVLASPLPTLIRKKLAGFARSPAGSPGHSG